MWITLSKNNQRRDQGNTLRLSVEKRGLSIRLNDQIAQAMGWSRGSRLGIKLGTEDHQGKIALYADPQGWTLQHAGTSSRKLRLMLAGTPVPGAPSRLSATNAEYRIDLGTMEVIVTLPWHKPAVVMSDADFVASSHKAQAAMDAIMKEAIAPETPIRELRPFPQQTRSMADVTRVTDPPQAEPDPPPIATSMGDVVTFLRREGDVVVKSSKDGEWHLNGSKNVDAKFLVERANRIRKRKREPEMRIA